MRGKVCSFNGREFYRRITPAYAGKSTLTREFGKAGRDHPRVCGEKIVGQIGKVHKGGSPPRMRGKVYERPGGFVETRITPAYAGKSRSGVTMDLISRDHPRVCGEKRLQRV